MCAETAAVSTMCIHVATMWIRGHRYSIRETRKPQGAGTHARTG